MENQNQTGAQQPAQKPPIHRIDGKQGLYLKVWEKVSPERGPFLSTEVGRSYRTEQGQWRVSRTLSPDQLNQLPSMVAEAGMYIRQWERQQRELKREQQPQQAAPQSQGLEAEHNKVMSQAVDPAPAQQEPQQGQAPER